MRREVIAPVEVAPPSKSRALNVSLVAVVVAEEKLASIRGVEVAEAKEEVAVTVPKVGEVVAFVVKV